MDPNARYETWVLRHTLSKRTLESTTTFLGMALKKKFKHEEGNYYVKPVLSCEAELKELLTDVSFDVKYFDNLKERVLSMDEDAQWEVQRLCEAREGASSGEGHLKSCWNVVFFEEQPRRKISQKHGKWWKRGNGKNKGPAEWVVVIKGNLLGAQFRTLPSKTSNPWIPKSVSGVTTQKEGMIKAMAAAKAQMQREQHAPIATRTMGGQPQGTVLRHVEKRPVVDIQEAEKRMQRMCADLFVKN